MPRLTPILKYRLSRALTLTLGSLLVCLTFAWFYSYRNGISISIWQATPLPLGTGYLSASACSPMCRLTGIALYSGDGCLGFTLRHGPNLGHPPSRWDAQFASHRPGTLNLPSGSFLNKLGFGVSSIAFDTRSLSGHDYPRAASFPSEAIYNLWTPYWLLFFLLALAIFFSSRRTLKHRRTLVQNLCPKCGYNLSHSPKSCPECGASPNQNLDPSPQTPDSMLKI